MKIIIAAALAAAVATPALATQPGYERAQVTVQTADLDLSSAAGQRQLDRRIAVAVTRVCGVPVFFSRDELAALADCEARAMAATGPQIEAARARRAMAVAARQ